MAILFSFLFALLLYFPVVLADGVGIIGAGKWMYKPTCAHACRKPISNSPLLCTSDDSDSSHHRRHTHGGVTPPECFLKDKAFLRTMALCIADRCARDDIRVSVIEEYWEGHLATGSVGDWSMRPVMSYSEALMFAREDVDAVGADKVPTAVSKEPLNQTSYIDEDAYITNYNGMKYFEIGENGHATNSLVISITTVFLPVFVSLLRFLPLPSIWISQVDAFFAKPVWGTRHRQPMAANIGLMPTRAQGLFIAYILVINIFLVVFPHSLKQPNSMAESDHSQLAMIVGDRAGVLAFANFVALFLFSSRNNILMWLTNWSNSTFLLLHRWVAYACIGQTVLHSLLMLYWYHRWADDIAESKLPYWYWGIIATLALCLMWPAAILPARQRAYEIFLAGHQILAALSLIGCFLHIWYLFEYKWGYEIWIYIAGGIWFVDRAWRIARIVRNGTRTAAVSVIDESNGHIRIQVEGVAADGHVYLYFPTLNWRFWENHPFSVLSSFSGSTQGDGQQFPTGSTDSTSDPEKNIVSAAVAAQKSTADDTDSNSSLRISSLSYRNIRPCTTILLRAQNGLTARLLSRTVAAGGNLRLPVWVESSYHSNPSIRNISQCSTLLCVAGGVGITAVAPLLRKFGGLRARLCWGVRSEALVRAIPEEIRQLGSRVDVETSVGARLAVKDIVAEELSRSEEKGDIAIVVCGPAHMADEVRLAISAAVSSRRSRRAVLFVDEAFSW